MRVHHHRRRRRHSVNPILHQKRARICLRADGTFAEVVGEAVVGMAAVEEAVVVVMMRVCFEGHCLRRSLQRHHRQFRHLQNLPF